MQAKRKHIVFFTPTLNRTGSEIVLFNLLPFALQEFDVTIITKYKGELYDQLPAGIKKHFLYRKQFGGLFSKLSRRIRSRFVVNGILKKYSNATWYINTIMLPEIVNYAQEHAIETIVHLHELQQMYSLLSEKDIKRLVEYPKQIVVNSNASAAVIKNFGRLKPVKLSYPSLDFSKIKPRYTNIRATLGIQEKTFVWIMSGTLDSNKNPFLFVDIAKELKARTTDFKMIWLGGKPGTSSFDQQYADYARKNKCDDVIIWMNKVGENYYEFLSLADGFVLTSQFESFSLVTLEALYLQLPVVANPCIGVSEILEDKYGYVAKEKNNAVEMATKMQEYMLGTTTINKEELRSRALEFSLDDISQEWQKWLKEQV